MSVMTVETDRSCIPGLTTLLPGATIGMVGGGQLGRMFAMAAATMGYRVIVLCENENDPAAQVADGCVVGALEDLDLVGSFAEACDVITLEFENIPAKTMARCSELAPTFPSHEVLRTTQHRIYEKTTFQENGLPVTPFAQVADTQSLVSFAQTHGWPVILKSATSGYDGKGQHRITDQAAAERVDWTETDCWIAEKFIDFQKEISVIVARRSDGEVVCYPPLENEHRNHILDVTVSPADASEELSRLAEAIARKAAEALDVVGLLCVEMFVVGDGDDPEIMINEVAPRPHNSGHLTIEAFQTSQFQQHVRAVCGLPLGGVQLICGGAAMVNLLGDLWSDRNPDWPATLETPGVNLHLYGKNHPKPGRKMGHITATASDVHTAKKIAVDARAKLG